MFVEFKQVKQNPGERRRWWYSDVLELVVWYGKEEKSDSIIGFQLSHAIDGRQYALTWRVASGTSYNPVDTGSAPPFEMRSYKSTAILQNSEHPNRVANLKERFISESSELDHSMHEFILEKVVGFIANQTK